MPLGTQRISASVPSVFMEEEIKPLSGVFSAFRSTAPAPSPKRITVERSLGSIILLYISTPTSKTLEACSVLSSAWETFNP